MGRQHRDSCVYYFKMIFVDMHAAIYINVWTNTYRPLFGKMSSKFENEMSRTQGLDQPNEHGKFIYMYDLNSL